MPNPNPIHPDGLAEIRTFTPRIMRWGFGVVMAIVLFISMLSYWRVEVGNQALNEIISHEQVSLEMLYRMQLAARDRSFLLFGAVHTQDPFKRDRQIQRFHEQGTAFGVARRQLLELPLTPFERDLLEQQRVLTAAVIPLQDRVIDHLESGKLAEAEQILIHQMVPTQNQMVDTLTALLNNATERTHAHAESRRIVQNRANALFVAGGLIGLLLTWGIFILVTRKMGGLITRLADASEQLHDSNLDLKFQQRALDEHNIVSVSDIHGNITYVNGKFCAVSQYSRRELLGQNHRLLKSGQHPDTFYEDIWATISRGKVWQGDICNRRKDGSLYWVASTILPFVGEDGLPSRYVSVRTDITAIKEAQLVLERSRDELERLVRVRSGELVEREEVLRTITNAAHDAVIMIDAAELVTYWNPAAVHMFGYSEAEITGSNLHDMILPERYLERAHAGFSHFIQNGTGPAIGQTTTLTAMHKSGKEFPVDISLSAIKLRGQWNAVGIVRDATARVQNEQQLKRLATTDSLTGICNRRHFDEVLASEINRVARLRTPLSLILFDIDHFKHINDHFGHQAGDRVLVELAATVRRSIRTTDLFARWGGEEFVILSPGCDLDGGRVLAEKLRELLEKQRLPDVGQVTCSFGVAEYVPGNDVDELMRYADNGLYHAKASGRNRVETSATAPVLGAG